MDVLRAALGESDADLLRRLLRHRARRDVRRPLPRPGRAAGARRSGRRVARARGELRSSRRPGSRRRCGPTSRTASTTATASSATASMPDSSRIRQLLDDVDAEPLPAHDDRELEVGNAFYGVVLPLYSRDSWSVLDRRPWQAAFDGDGSLAAAALRRLPVPRLRRLHRQQQRGQLRDQLPRRPVVDPGARRCRPTWRTSSRRRRRSARCSRGGCSPTAVASRCSPPSRRRDIKAAGARADRGDRYDARPGHAVRLGAELWPSSPTRVSWSAATATATPATPRATTASTTRSTTTCSTGTVPEDGLAC